MWPGTPKFTGHQNRQVECNIKMLGRSQKPHFTSFPDLGKLKSTRRSLAKKICAVGTQCRELTCIQDCGLRY